MPNSVHFGLFIMEFLPLASVAAGVACKFVASILSNPAFDFSRQVCHSLAGHRLFLRLSILAKPSFSLHGHLP
jgi:hypothetical protein